MPIACTFRQECTPSLDPLSQPRSSSQCAHDSARRAPHTRPMLCASRMCTSRRGSIDGWAAPPAYSRHIRSPPPRSPLPLRRFSSPSGSHFVIARIACAPLHSHLRLIIMSVLPRSHTRTILRVAMYPCSSRKAFHLSRLSSTFSFKYTPEYPRVSSGAHAFHICCSHLHLPCGIRRHITSRTSSVALALGLPRSMLEHS